MAKLNCCWWINSYIYFFVYTFNEAPCLFRFRFSSCAASTLLHTHTQIKHLPVFFSCCIQLFELIVFILLVEIMSLIWSRWETVQINLSVEEKEESCKCCNLLSIEILLNSYLISRLGKNKEERRYEYFFNARRIIAGG